MAEAGKPGTNWKQVGPQERKRLAPLLRKYRKSAHPFTECVRDNTKRFGQDRAQRVCAVLKDLIRHSTSWHGKHATAAAGADEAWVEEAWDEVVAPALDGLGLTAEELADWLEGAAEGGPPVEAAAAREWLTGRR